MAIYFGHSWLLPPLQPIEPSPFVHPSLHVQQTPRHLVSAEYTR